MSGILGQISYPVFLYCVFAFFMLASVFSFIVGISFAFRNATMLRFFELMNTNFSTRQAIKPLTMPRFVEPVLLRHPKRLGAGITLGAVISILLLWSVDANVFQPLFLGTFQYFTAGLLASYSKSFLLIGNGLCAAVGLLMMFFPRLLSRIEAHTDKWLTLRKQTRSWDEMHHDVDKWVFAHPTVFGTTLSILSLGLFVSMYALI